MSEPVKFRKRPVEVEAIQFNGENYAELYDWSDGSVQRAYFHGMAQIVTLEGTMAASKDDWIIKGVQGEFYPCKPDIFAATYGRVEDTTDE